MKDSKSTNTTSYIHQDTKLTANITCEGNLHVSGQITGDIDVKGMVILNGTGSVNGNIAACNAKISGKINGDIRVSESLTLHPSARVFGNIYTKYLITESGAEINGMIHAGKSVDVHQNLETENTRLQKKAG